jgi:hypothetical protein
MEGNNAIRADSAASGGSSVFENGLGVVVPDIRVHMIFAVSSKPELEGIFFDQRAIATTCAWHQTITMPRSYGR